MANTRAPTWTSSTGGWATVATDRAVFRKKGGSLTEKLEDVFEGYDKALEYAFGTGMQVSACTLYGGGSIGMNCFNWTNPIAPNPVFVDHIIVKVSTVGSSGSRMTIGRSTNTGAAANSLALANRILAENSYPTRNNMTAGGLVLQTATVHDSSSAKGAGTGFTRAGTFMQGAYQYLDGRTINRPCPSLAGTVYVFWYKAYAGG